MQPYLTVIPAKLGSTRLPRKNIALLAGKPLISYTIEAALSSGVCGEVMVSTESPEIAEISRKFGAEVPFLRPEHLGSDPYGVVDVCMHVLEEYEKRGYTFKTLIILLPTSPFRTDRDIAQANDIFINNKASFLMSVSEFDHNPFGALLYQNNSESIMVSCFPDFIGRKRHEIPVTFRANGAVCIVDIQAFKEQGTYYGDPLHTYLMPWERSIDIDNEIDLEFAEYLIKSGRIF